MKSNKINNLFPWVELIPFVFYILAILYSITPTAVLNELGFQDIGHLSIPVAAIVGTAAAIVGFIMLSKLHGRRKTSTMILSTINAIVFIGLLCASMFSVVLLLRGALTA